MGISLITTFIGGIATVFTPCILPVLPIYLGIFANSASISRNNRLNIFLQTLIFGAGFSMLFVLMGLGAASVSNFIVTNKPLITIIGSVLILIMGLIFADIIKIPFLMREYRIRENRNMEDGSSGRGSRFASFISGVVFAAGWSPCAGPILGSVLTYVALKSTSLLTGGLLMSIYSLGILTPFLAISLFADRLLPRIKKIYKIMPLIQKAGGIIMIAGALILLYSQSGYIGAVLSKGRSTSVTHSDSNSPELLFILSRHCPECKKLSQIMPEVKNDCLGRDIIIKELYIEDNPSLRGELNINVFPTIILFDRYGREIKRVFGRQDITSLRIAAATLINGECAGESPSLDKVRSTDSTCSESSDCRQELYQ